MGKWWSWIPGLHGVALNKRRRKALSSITGERLFVERMAQRQRPDDESFDKNYPKRSRTGWTKSLPMPLGQTT